MRILIKYTTAIDRVDVRYYIVDARGCRVHDDERSIDLDRRFQQFV